jgi:hypothetical protein
MLSDILNDKYISTALTIMIGLYAVSIGPNLPSFVKDLFANSIFKIIILFIVVVRANKNPTLSIVIAIAFVMTVDYLQKRETINAFTTVGYKLGENSCEEEEATPVEATLKLENQAQYLNQVETMANFAYLENELDETFPFEDFTEVDYKIDTESVVESPISPLELKNKSKYPEEVETFVSM